MMISAFVNFAAAVLMLWTFSMMTPTDYSLIVWALANILSCLGMLILGSNGRR